VYETVEKEGDWLQLGGTRRVTDEGGFVLKVAELVPVVAVRLRRDFALIRSLVFAHAILHQVSRSRDERGRIVASLADYSAVRELVADIVAEGIGATVSNDIRQTADAVEVAIAKVEPESKVRLAQVQAELHLDDRATRRRLAQAVEGGFIVNKNPGRGKTALYAIGDPIPDDLDVLPDADELRRAGDPDNPDNPDSDLRAERHAHVGGGGPSVPHETPDPPGAGRVAMDVSTITSRA
jgi:hypothetical protein